MNPHLKAVPDFATGEITDDTPASMGEALAENTMLKREVKGWRLRYFSLEQEHAKKAREDPRRKDVEAVLNYWAEMAVSTGWWVHTPFFEPDHPRWKAVNARLKAKRKDGTHPYSVDYLLRVADGALAQPKSRTERQWVDADSIYKAGNLEKHYLRAVDPAGERIRTMAELPREWRHVDTKELSRRCECGHLRVFHSRSDPERHGWQPCLDDGCVCMDFDDTFVDWDKRTKDGAA